MKALRVLVFVLCLVAVGCEDDPAGKVKVVAHPPAQPAVNAQSSQPAGGNAQSPSTTTAGNRPSQVADVRPLPTPARAPQPQTLATKTNVARPASLEPRISDWLKEFCPIPHEDSSGPSSFTVNGPCQFQHQGLANCQAIGDDFLVAITRKARQGTMVTFINVEHYSGPGSYEGSQIFVAVQNGTTIHRWSSDTVNTVVGPGEAFLDISNTRLELEPTLQDCSKLIGPATGYQFQCGGLGYAYTPSDKIDEVVSGRLRCAGKE